MTFLKKRDLKKYIYLKNHDIFEKSLNIYFSKQTFVTQISASGGSLEQHILRRGSAAKIHVTLGVLDMKKFENH